MRFLGGKHRQAKQIVAAIETHTPLRNVVEPFCGGASISAALAARGFWLELSDAHPALIAMWRAAVFDGWSAPKVVTEEGYRAAKELPDTDPLKAAIGFGCSFGAKYFGGYANARSTIRNFAAEASRGITHKAELLRMRTKSIEYQSFFDISIPCGRTDRQVVLYCDPPYAGTQGYSIGTFDHAAFWTRCDEWADAGHAVFVSEYVAPQHWTSILDLRRQQTLRGGNLTADLSDQVRVERLFVRR